MNHFPFLDHRRQQQQARIARLSHLAALTRLRAACCVDTCRGETRRQHLRQLRARRQHLRFLKRQAERGWPFSIN